MHEPSTVQSMLTIIVRAMAFNPVKKYMYIYLEFLLSDIFSYFTSSWPLLLVGVVQGSHPYTNR